VARLSAGDAFLLVAAGLAGGLTGSIAGLASLFTYPALLATGLGPITANVTNTVALVCVTVGAVPASRPELRGQGARVLTLGAFAVLGGAVGAGLLLGTSDAAFERIAPWLIAAAALVVLFAPRPRRPEGAGEGGRGLAAAVFAVGIYAGYFGAAAGVVLLAILLTTTRDELPVSNAIKNAVLGLANIVAAVAFAVAADVEWVSALPLAAGLLVGGRLGPVVVRRAPARAVRTGIGIAGLGLAVKLGLDAYG
jgi:uncharacterized membrane protein YfcA